jgi:hypothetical protein
VFALSDDDYPKIREIISKALAEAMKVNLSSPEEDAAVICVDLFRL